MAQIRRTSTTADRRRPLRRPMRKTTATRATPTARPTVITWERVDSTLVGDLTGQLAELGLDVVTGDRLGCGGHGVSFSGVEAVRSCPRVTASTATAATADDGHRADEVRHPRPVAGERGPGLGLEYPQEGHGQDDQADGQRHRTDHTEQDEAAQSLSGVERLLLDVVDDQLDAPRLPRCAAHPVPCLLPLRPRATVLLGLGGAQVGPTPRATVTTCCSIAPTLARVRRPARRMASPELRERSDAGHSRSVNR